MKNRMAQTIFLCNDDLASYMALYMVKARPRKELLENLQKDLSSGKISKMRPFGHALQYSLENARIDTENPDYAMW